jgi:hypothetical protein
MYLPDNPRRLRYHPRELRASCQYLSYSGYRTSANKFLIPDAILFFASRPFQRRQNRNWGWGRAWSASSYVCSSLLQHETLL